MSHGIGNRSGAGGFLAWKNAVWLALACITGAVGVVLGCLSWHFASPPMGVWASVLLLAAPALAIVGSALDCVRTSLPAALEEAVDGRDRAAFALKFIQGARAVAFMATSFAAVLWVCESGGMLNISQFLIPYALVCVASLAIYLPWLAALERRILQSLAVHRLGLEELKASLAWHEDGGERKSADRVL